MIIAADRAIPGWEEAFSELGEVLPFAAKDLKPADLRHADVLVVRTVTPVDATLLEGSAVRFVAAASAGTDHVDIEYLESRGIRFSCAAGCNANSVSEYIATVLHIIASRKGWTLNEKSIAIVGVGNVGSRVAQKARALGMRVLLCDPPLRDLTGDPRYQSLEDVLGADILSFHVPLAPGGPYPTWHMVDANLLKRLSPTQFIINSSRGAVFDGTAVKTALSDRRIAGAVIDVWEDEPRIDYSLLESAEIGTPHIAGNALDGKIRATEMTREALYRHLNIKPGRQMSPAYPEDRVLRPATGTDSQESVRSVLLQAFDVPKEDADLRALRSVPREKAAEGFELLRTRKPLRPEFRHFIVDLDKRHINLGEAFSALGFQVRHAVQTD